MKTWLVSYRNYKENIYKLLWKNELELVMSGAEQFSRPITEISRQLHC